jgi:hypothetical protein
MVPHIESPHIMVPHSLWTLLKVLYCHYRAQCPIFDQDYMLVQIECPDNMELRSKHPTVIQMVRSIVRGHMEIQPFGTTRAVRSSCTRKID